MAITYEDLERVLIGVGFAPGPMDGVHQTFVHEPTGLTFSSPLMTRPARAVPTYTAALRGYLRWAGLLDDAGFEARVHAGQKRAPVRRRQPTTSRPAAVA